MKAEQRFIFFSAKKPLCSFRKRIPKNLRSQHERLAQPGGHESRPNVGLILVKETALFLQKTGPEDVPFSL
jgi:hypothetical protein